MYCRELILPMRFVCVATGAGESGKSTVVKQMQLIHGAGFTDDQRQVFVLDFCRNVIVNLVVRRASEGAGGRVDEECRAVSNQLTRLMLSASPELKAILDVLADGRAPLSPPVALADSANTKNAARIRVCLLSFVSAHQPLLAPHHANPAR